MKNALSEAMQNKSSTRDLEKNNFITTTIHDKGEC